VEEGSRGFKKAEVVFCCFASATAGGGADDEMGNTIRDDLIQAGFQ